MATFGRLLQLSTLGNLDDLLRLVAGPSRSRLDLLNDIITLQDLTENNVATIKPAVDEN